MNEETKDSIVHTADAVVDGFVAHWKQEPYRWLQEIDVQVELVARLIRAIPLIRPNDKTLLTVVAPLSVRIKGDSKVQTLSRVTCEPYVKPPGGGRRILPDIVIWDDGVEADGCINDGKWPILWVCEIKYKTAKVDRTDLDRLSNLLGGAAPRVRRGHLLSLHWGGDALDTEKEGLNIEKRLIVTEGRPDRP